MGNDEFEWTINELPLKSLSLWDENARFPEEYFNKSEEDLISYFLSKKKFKIEDLAKEVVKEFDLPQLERLVVLNISGRFIVLEGNRRLTVYKLLLNPLLSKDPEIQKFFIELKNLVKINENFKLEVVITQIKEEGLRYLDRKHNKSNNEVPWEEVERRNFAIRRVSKTNKDVFRVELARAVKGLNLPENIKEDVLGKGFITNFFRILDSTRAREKLGFELKENGTISIHDQTAFNELLKVIVFNVWNKKDFRGNTVDSRTLNKKESIEAYLNSVSKQDAEKVDTEIKKSTSTNLLGEITVSKITAKSKPLSILRKHLINSTFYIKDNRINDIYNELKNKLVVDETPNAAAVLFRVFLECSLDYYININSISVKTDETLSGKIQKAADYLEKSGIANKRDLVNIRRVAAKDNNSYLSVENFHSFVHDYKSTPIPSELKKYWENLDSFFHLIWK